MAIELQRSMLPKGCSLIRDWTIFVNPFPDPVTLTEAVCGCWNDAQREFVFLNFADAIPHSIDQASYPSSIIYILSPNENSVAGGHWFADSVNAQFVQIPVYAYGEQDYNRTL